mgnify:CR=1 FL=1
MKWNIGEPAGNSRPFYSVIRSDGRIIALQIPDKDVASDIAYLPYIMAAYKVAELHHADSGDRLPKAYSDLFDLLSKLREPK